MNPVSLSASGLTWTTFPALVVAILILWGTQTLWTIVERRYFPVGAD